MLRRHGEVLRLVLMGADLVLTAACWLGTYQMRFVSGVLPVLRGMPPEDLYYWSTFGVLALWHVAFRLGGLYEPWRLKRLGQEAWVISRAVLLGLTALIVVSFVYRYQDTEYSRLFLLVFVPTNVAALVGSRVVVRLILRAMRSSGLNLRHLLVIGSGPLARQVIDKVRANPWAGLRVVGMIADEHEPRDPHQGVEVVGGMDDLSGAIERSGAQQAFIALPFERFGCIKRVMAELADSTVAVRLVADLADFGLVMNTSIDDFDGLPVLSLVDRPAVGAMALVKRGFDLLFSALVLVLLSPLLALLAIAVRVSVGGSVIYRQERMGLDGKRFEILKFRTMPPDAEVDGAVWQRAGDDRATPLGALLRRTSLDELPQFWNVLMGEMSVVGPRPERPVFIENFRRDIPRYHQRHMVKAGITGWAQVNGWRGDTELGPRIAHDLYYIENWTLWLDVKIIALTVLRMFRDPHAR